MHGREIGELFARKMSEVFNSVSFSAAEMQTLLNDIEADVSHQCATDASMNCYNSHRITQFEVVKALKLLKVGKSDGNHDFSSDFLINAPASLAVHLALLFESIL